MPKKKSSAVLSGKMVTSAFKAHRAKAKKAKKEAKRLAAATAGDNEGEGKNSEDEETEIEEEDEEAIFWLTFYPLLDETTLKRKSGKFSVNAVTELMKSLETWKPDVDLDQWKALIEEAKKGNEGEVKGIVAIEKAGRRYLEWKRKELKENAQTGESGSQDGDREEGVHL